MNEEKETSSVKIELVSPVDESTRQLVYQFIESQSMLTKPLFPSVEEAKNDPQKKELFLKGSTFRTLLGTSKQVIDRVISHGDKEKSFVYVARESGEVTGISIVGVREQEGKLEVDTNFIGVAYAAQRKGLASKLLQYTHDRLLSPEYSIKEYEVSLHQDSHQLYEKNDIQLTPIEGNPKLFLAGLRD
jgi:hypothetical protein